MPRTILTWRILGEDLVGTCHVPTPGRPGVPSAAPRVGVLLLNPGAGVRSGNSDLSARIGDRLALRGFPVFRFDLSGLGDSSGATPVDLDAYWTDVVDGRNDEATVALIERIQLEFGVVRAVVGGLCAAVLPSVRALGRASSAPAGLILLEPNFRLDAGDGPGTARSAALVEPFDRNAAGLRRTFGALWPGGQSRIARAARPLRTFLGVLKQRIHATLPRDANRPLIALWQEGFPHGVHSLVVVAEGQENDRYVTRILASMPTRGPGGVTCVRVPETNHLFTLGRGRDAVLVALERWMLESFGGGAEPAVRLPEACNARASGG